MLSTLLKSAVAWKAIEGLPYGTPVGKQWVKEHVQAAQRRSGAKVLSGRSGGEQDPVALTTGGIPPA